ncbi:MAG: isocitrate/isopropylmalate dehydrogenase family protein [Methanomassiliicoccales archaeon]|nr:isocitrate/isopropylmalate dehydrogenase family protein [Methanomassiliicoccales archaeon]MDD1773527.1 isocitrate/isopropylmalate dehydrogenase family protein [Methanomassiliicoccales archaeon]
MRKVVLVPGDGIGPEIVASALRVIEASGAKIEWERVEAGKKVLEETGRTIPPKFFDMAMETGVVLKGPVATPVGGGFRSINVMIRQRLNLFANVRLVKSFPGVKALHEGVDMVVVRENTEGLYAGIERESSIGTVETVKVTSAEASERIGRFAFDYAEAHGRKLVTAVHKANILKKGDGLFLKSVAAVAPQYPGIEFNDMMVDNAVFQLVTNPKQFDVIVTQNLYGDIISEMCAGLIGSLALVPGANFGDNLALFEAAHGSAPMIAGKGIANPTGVILSAAWMLDYIGLSAESKSIVTAVRRVLGEGKVLPQDMGGSATTQEYTEALISTLV